MKKSSAVLYISILVIMACLTTCLFGMYGNEMSTVEASDIFNDYKQIIYNQDSGLGSLEINCVYQSQSGYIWIGTDGGLYRFNGAEFRLFSLWDTDKQDVYYINSIFQDSKGRLWVCTNNYGLFYIEGGTSKHFDSEYYSGVKSVNDVCESSDGTIFVASAYGVYTVLEPEMTLFRIENLAKHNIDSITSVNDEIWGIYSGNTIFRIDSAGAVEERPSSDYTIEELSSISSDENGRIFIGTIGNEVITMSGFNSAKTLLSGKNGINTISVLGSRIYACTDNGVGYFRSDDSFVSLNHLKLDSYISDMLVDYEGNFWFASKRAGLLCLSKSKFSNMNNRYGIPENITNAICKVDNKTYIGTDEGLFIFDKDMKIVSNDLTQYLDGTSIRDIVCDDNGNIWFATYRRYGVVKYAPNGKYASISKSGGLISNLVKCLYVLQNGDVAAGTEDGISIISSNCEILNNYDYNSGLEYSNIDTLYQDEDGVIYAGSDGGGLYKISGSSIQNFNQTDGLNSNVITSITRGNSGLWIGTNNGLTFYDGTFRSVSNIDFSNNIYSCIANGNMIYIIGSKGLIFADEEELLGTKELSERYYSSGDGIDSLISSGARNLLDDEGVIYICTNTGVITFDTKNININDIPPRITVSEVDVDGEIYYYNQIGGEITIPADTQRVEISFAVLSFSNRENIQVKYQLEGFDNEPEYLSGSDVLKAVYTNLDGGKYTLVVSASNGDGIESKEQLSFNIVKEMGVFERKSIRYSFFALLLLIVMLITMTAFRLQKKFVGKNRELEDLTKVHEDIIKSSSAKTDYLANMSNAIKLPINAMISSANNILKDGTADQNTEKGLREIINSGQDVLGKVDETILLARLESGAEQVVSEPYSITTLVCDISDNMLNNLSEQPIKFLVDLGENIPDILIGDFDKIKTVLSIILENAIKYTKEGSIILSVDCYDITGEDSGKDSKDNGSDSENAVNLVFSISDTGIGISEDTLEHIFEIYYPDESKKSVIRTGNGVSLSIAKKISDIMDGDLSVDSTEGAGSTFTFSIYQTKPSAEGNAIPLNENTIDRVSREEAQRMWAPELSVLLVDDVEISRNVAIDVITTMEIKCDTASNGPSAIDMVMNNDYDLVFMDIAMPVMNGIDCLREIRELSGDSFRRLPVIAMSEDVIGKNRQDIIDEGFADVVLKPFDITVLAGILLRNVSPDKIKYRTNDVTQYITESRYSEGLKRLEDVFDVAGVLERIGGSIDVYNRILSTFYNQNKDSAKELRYKFNNDYRGFRNKIHNIRNGCQNIGAFEAAEITLRIENAINLGNKTYVRDNINLVFDSLKVINNSISDYLKFIEDSKGLSDEEYAALHGNTGVLNSHAADSEGTVSEKDRAEMPAAGKADVYSGAVAETSDGNESEYGAPDYDENDYDDSSYDDKEYSGSDYNDSEIINIDKLRAMREATYIEDMNQIRKIYSDIAMGLYGAEDVDFLNVLRDSIDKGDFVEINELLGTYISLKSTL